MKERETTINATKEPIAVVGIGCRLPGGVSGPTEFWRFLQQGRDLFTGWPQERINLCNSNETSEQDVGTGLPLRGAYLSDVARFDADFFCVSPREAAAMDPQQRLLLEVTWETLEDTGLPIEQVRDTKTGVFMGAMGCDYLRLQDEHQALSPYTALGVDTSLIANRISYCLGLRGPSLTVNTASSSSLVAVHLGCQSLRAGEVELALVGGVNLILTSHSTSALQQMGVLSSDGHARAFTTNANGYVRGEGVGCVALKKLTTALKDRDRIYCLIAGSSVNNNGGSEGIAAPSQTAQVQLLNDAYSQACVSREQVQYVEAHGSGTVAGDKAELEALAEFFGVERPIDAPLLFGTVKNNIGHLEAAAGIFGFIKMALAFANRELPASRTDENAQLIFDELNQPLRLVKHNQSWLASGKDIGVAGVSSFGYGGTNCHVVLCAKETAIHKDKSLEQHEADTGRNGTGFIKNKSVSYLVPISASSPQALVDFAQAAALAFQEESSDSFLKDWAYSAALRRTHHHIRKAIIAGSCEELCNKLKALTVATVFKNSDRAEDREVVLCLSEPVPDWSYLAHKHLTEEAIYRQHFENCARVVREEYEWELEPALNKTDDISDASEETVRTLFYWAVQTGLIDLAIKNGLQIESIIVRDDFSKIIAAQITGDLSTSEAAKRIVELNKSTRQNLQSGRLQQFEEIRCKKNSEKTRRGRILVTVAESSVQARKQIDAPNQYSDLKEEAAVIALQGKDRLGLTGVLTAIGEIYEKGGNINWWYQHADGPCRVISLPLYRWQGQHHWLRPQDKPMSSENDNHKKTDKPIEEANGYGERCAHLQATVKDESESLLIETYLRECLGRLLDHNPSEIDSTIPLLYLGVESLVAMELEHALATDWRVHVNLKQQLQETSMAQLAELVAAQIAFITNQTVNGLEDIRATKTNTAWEIRRI